MCELDATTQKMIVLHYYEGITFSEVGQVLAVSETQAKDTTNKGIKKMRLTLSEKCQP